MRSDDDTRTLEQEIAAGESEKTPFVAIGTVAAAIAVLFALALGLAVLAYVLS